MLGRKDQSPCRGTYPAYPHGDPVGVDRVISPSMRMTPGPAEPEAEENKIPSAGGHGHMTFPSIPASADSLFAGAVYRPGDRRYDARRANWRAVNSHPAVIVDAVSERDVVTALRVAGDHGLPVAIQNSGHGVAVPYDHALLLRTGSLAGVSVDPVRRRARIGAGVLLREIMMAAAPYGLAPLSGSTPWLGAAGYLLGGGVGWLTRLHGYAADSLLSARVVTPAGHVVQADAGHEPELFWGLRGAGGSLGVVTALELNLFPLPALYGGIVVFAVAEPLRLLTRYRDWTAGHPDTVSTALVLRRRGDRPAGNGAVLAGLRVLVRGTPEEADRYLTPFLAQTGRQLLNSLRPVSLAERAQAAEPAPAPTPAGGIELFQRVPDTVLAALAVALTASTAPLSLVELRHWGGAIGRPLPHATPAGPRGINYGITLEARGGTGQVCTGAEVRALLAWLRMRSSGTAMRNLLTDTADTERAYPAEQRARLAALKRAWDPADLLRLGHRIPAEGWPSAARAARSRP